ncbi:MAG TPA: hypothetical protein VGM58_08095 [Verrucomicrobiae bacterium]
MLFPIAPQVSLNRAAGLERTRWKLLDSQFNFITVAARVFQRKEKEGGLIMPIIKSGEICNISGVYKAHCPHASESPFSKSETIPRCDHCPFDILWVLIKPELLESEEAQ